MKNSSSTPYWDTPLYPEKPMPITHHRTIWAHLWNASILVTLLYFSVTITSPDACAAPVTYEFDPLLTSPASLSPNGEVVVDGVKVLSGTFQLAGYPAYDLTGLAWDPFYENVIGGLLTGSSGAISFLNLPPTPTIQLWYVTPQPLKTGVGNWVPKSVTPMPDGGVSTLLLLMISFIVVGPLAKNFQASL